MHPLRLALGGALLLIATVPAVAQDRNPVPLQTPRPWTPEETVGTGLTPTVDVRVRVDERGRVSKVDVLRIAPRSQYDEAFRRATLQTLASWRFAPAMTGGKPKPTFLQWTIQFPALGEPRDLGDMPLHLALAEEEERILERWRILARPLEWRKERRDRLSEWAVTNIDPEHRRMGKTPHFIVMTDAPDETVIQKLGGNFEAVYATLVRLFADTVPAQPDPIGRVRAFVFASREGYDKFRAKAGVSENVDGFYGPVGVMAFHLEMPSSQALLNLMIHETVHAFVDRHLVKPGAVVPRWLGEGFAEYVGMSQIKDGKIAPGTFRRFELQKTPWGTTRGKSMGAMLADEAKRAIASGKGIPLDELLRAKVTEFYGGQRHLHYAQSWMLVHFLRHGEEGWVDDQFPRLMLYVCEGYPAHIALTEVYGKRPQDLEGEFRAYVKRF